jgi:hypothetical protein
MSSNRLNWVVRIASVLLTATLPACAGNVGAVDGEQAGAEQTERTSEAVTSCNAPVQAYMTYLQKNDTSEAAGYGRPYSVTATVSAPALGLQAHTVWLDRRDGRYVPRFCFGHACSGGYWVYTGIAGDNFGDSMSIDTEGNFIITVNGVGAITNLRVVAGSCSEPSGSTTTILQGTDPSGNVFTVRLDEQYIT